MKVPIKAGCESRPIKLINKMEVLIISIEPGENIQGEIQIEFTDKKNNLITESLKTKSYPIPFDYKTFIFRNYTEVDLTVDYKLTERYKIESKKME